MILTNNGAIAPEFYIFRVMRYILREKIRILMMHLISRSEDIISSPHHRCAGAGSGYFHQQPAWSCWAPYVSCNCKVAPSSPWPLSTEHRGVRRRQLAPDSLTSHRPGIWLLPQIENTWHADKLWQHFLWLKQRIYWWSQWASWMLLILYFMDWVSENREHN